MKRIALISEHASPIAAIGGTDTGGQNIAVAELARPGGWPAGICGAALYFSAAAARDGPDEAAKADAAAPAVDAAKKPAAKRVVKKATGANDASTS